MGVLLDVSGEAEMDVLVFGSINSDLSLKLEDFPCPGETVLAARFVEGLGGKGANQAAAAARLGARTAMVGAVGGDERGRVLRDQLARAGVDVSRVRSLAALSGLAVVMVNTAGENLIAVAPGANQMAQPDTFLAHGQDGPRVRLTQLECGVETARRFLDQGPGGSVRILNAAPYIAEAQTVFELPDAIVVNEVELVSYAGRSPGAGEDLAFLARSLIVREDQTAIVTLGAKGALIVSAGESAHVDGRLARVVDTTGAGDCFCGALAAYLAKDRDLEAATRFATKAASLAVERPGAASAMPSLSEVEQLTG